MNNLSAHVIRPAKLSELPGILAWIAECAARQGFHADRINQIEVAAEEALVNIMNYAYPDGNGTVEIRCTGTGPSSLVLEFIDTGSPFDVLSVPDPDLAIALEDKEIGGLGVFLMKQLINHVEYRRDGAANRLTFIIGETKDAAV
ncbi:MAG: ATP-binding protein [Nitrospiraceae bacterium]|jgi:anti-sigma regulatory factor (Ser/Thr protein kinase)|nr:ATP-binding protein [Nitrospiraceae bacterium]